MVYVRLILAVIYWGWFPRKLMASPLPLWGISWALMAGILWAALSSSTDEASQLTIKADESPTPEVLGSRADNWQGEIDRMWQIMANRPDLRDGWLYLGWLETNFGSMDKAGLILEKLQAIDPNHPEVRQLERILSSF
jgi:hypothetical protein